MRIIVAETLDPDGALARWASPDLAALGHEVLPLPTQEVAPFLGARGLGAWIEACVESFRPALVIVCPPYDHVGAATWDRCRALGAKVVGFAMDEPLFAAARARPAIVGRYEAAVRSYDRYYVTAPDAAAALAARGLPARWLRWALSATTVDEASEASAAAAALPDVRGHAVIVGRAYARRVALAAALAEVVPVALFGHGWPRVVGRARVHGPLTGPDMRTVLAAAGVLVTTGDWEDQAIPMVKARLLEAAFAGAVQVAQRSPDLDAYFPEDEVARFDGWPRIDDLAAACAARLADPIAARAAAGRAHARALREHTWSVRFAEMADDLGLPANGAADRIAPMRPAAWRAVIAAAAADAERRGAERLAAALWSEVGDAMGEARVLAGFDPGRAVMRAGDALRDAEPRATVGLYARVPTPAPALGHVGLLDPGPELEAIRIGAMLARDDVAAALAAIEDLASTGDFDRLVATAALLEDDGEPAHAVVWRTLFAAALAATPSDTSLLDQHRVRFTATLARERGALVG